MASLVSFYARTSREQSPTTVQQSHVLRCLTSTRAHASELGYPEPRESLTSATRFGRHALIPFASYRPTIMVEKVNDAVAMLTALGQLEICARLRHRGVSARSALIWN